MIPHHEDLWLLRIQLWKIVLYCFWKGAQKRSSIKVDDSIKVKSIKVEVNIQLVLQHQRQGLPSSDSRLPSLGPNQNQAGTLHGFLGRLLASCNFRASSKDQLFVFLSYECYNMSVSTSLFCCQLMIVTCQPFHLPHCSLPCGTGLMHHGALAPLPCSRPSRI